jgi:Pyruvate/2-oxoacid:ferredoxin oxidoreductase delta subunit
VVVLPKVQADRCVHSLCETASCSHCVQACPAGAWHLNDDGLFLDTVRCDGCGLCAAACTQEALQIPVSALVIERAGLRMALAACERAVSGGGAGVLPCVHAMGLRGLARLAAQGVDAIFLCVGDCHGCSRAGARRVEEDLRVLNRILRSRQLPPLLSETVAERIWIGWRGGHRADSAVSTERRRFLFNSVREIARLARVLPETEERELPRPASAMLERRGTGLAEWRPQLDVGRCDGCDACMRLCPTDALQHETTAGVYRVFPDACTGCRLCSDACSAQAIEPVALGEAAAYEVPLADSRCRACGVAFHLPVSAANGASLCPVCVKANHYRLLFQLLDPADAGLGQPEPGHAGTGVCRE